MLGLLGVFLVPQPEPYLVRQDMLGNINQALQADRVQTLNIPVPPGGASSETGQQYQGYHAFWDDGSSALVVPVAGTDGAESRQILQALRSRFSYQSSTTSSGQTRLTLRDERGQVLLFIAGPLVFAVQAADRQAIENRITALPVLFPNPEAVERTQALWDMLPILGLVLLAYLVLQLFLWPRMASWAAKVPPSVDTPVPVEELQQRIMGINEMDLPFQVRASRWGKKLIIEHRYADAKWAGIMETQGLTAISRIIVQLPKKGNRVRSLDTSRTIRWSAGVSGSSKARLGGAMSAAFFRGITFTQFHGGMVYGLMVQDGQPVLGSQSWRFSRKEMKDPLVQIITQSGYEFYPVITFWRLING